MPSSSTRRSITAVLVLYKRTLAESTSFSSLIQIFNANPLIAGHFSLVVYDNSPYCQEHEISADFPVHFEHDPANGGLAAAYNFALSRAAQDNHDWLLLLDQDTTLTYDFFSELVASTSTLQAQHDVAAVVPKLAVRGEIESPQIHFIDRLQRQFSRFDPNISRDAVGIQDRPLVAYNSGATLRVSALQRVGGFPNEFWLDYLDHAIFHSLCVSGYRINVMNTVLDHSFSEVDLNSIPLWRHRNTLTAQTLFVKRAGTFADRQLYRLWLLRYSRRLWSCCRDRRMWKEAALQAIRLKVARKHSEVSPTPGENNQTRVAHS